MPPVWAWRIDFSCDSSPGFPLGSVLLSLLRQCLGVAGLSFPLHSQEADAFPNTVQCFAHFVPGSPWRLGTSRSSSHPRGPLGDIKAVSPLSSCPPASDGIAGHCSTCLWCWGCPLWMGCCILPGCFGGLRTELLMDSSPCVPGKISPGLCWSLGLTTQRLCSRIFISALLGCVPGVSD